MARRSILRGHLAVLSLALPLLAPPLGGACAQAPAPAPAPADATAGAPANTPLGGALQAAPPAPALLGLKPRATLTVTAPDGVTLAAQEWGDPAGPPVIFIHGFAQTHLSWAKQLIAPELAGFRMITFDLRGHGLSAKPTERAAYQDASRWADDLKAVIEATGVRKPVVVAWSYGGRVVGDYLVTHGPSALGGLNLVAAVTNAKLNMDAPAAALSAGMLSPDLGLNVAATREFMRQCFSKLPPPEELEALLVATGFTPLHVRRDLIGRPTQYEAVLKALEMPVLVTHGDEDRAVKQDVSRWTIATVPNAMTSFYTGVGHSPFWEDPGRFNRELVNLVRSAQSNR